ncbi:MAG: PRC-barrel domain-containing protein [Aestuariivirga sp.]
MLLAASALKGYSVEALDGAIGTVKDLLFDDRTWQIKWLVVQAGNWLVDRKVLVHPSAVDDFDGDRQTLNVSLTRIQVKAGPPLSTDQPVSRQHELETYGYYGWDPMWGGDMYGSMMLGRMAGPPRYFGNKERYDDLGLGNVDGDSDPHLRSFNAVKGYHVQASDGDMGHIANLLIDNVQWGVRYLIVETSNWWMGKQVLMAPYAISSINWLDRTVYLDVTQAEVKASPEWDPATAIVENYQHGLHKHYGWGSYGW